MSLVSNEGDSEQNEIRNLQEKLESTMSLVKQLSAQLAELKEQVSVLGKLELQLVGWNQSPLRVRGDLRLLGAGLLLTESCKFQKGTPTLSCENHISAGRGFSYPIPTCVSLLPLRKGRGAGEKEQMPKYKGLFALFERKLYFLPS